MFLLVLKVISHRNSFRFWFATRLPIDFEEKYHGLTSKKEKQSGTDAACQLPQSKTKFVYLLN